MIADPMLAREFGLHGQGVGQVLRRFSSSEFRLSRPRAPSQRAGETWIGTCVCWRKTLVLLALILAGSLQELARAQQLQAPIIASASDGILKAFQTHALVAIGDE